MALRDSRRFGSVGASFAERIGFGFVLAVGLAAATSAGAATPVRVEDRVAAMDAGLAHGRVVVHRFTLAGRSVRGAFEVVHHGRDGSTRTIAARRVERTADLEPSDARIDGDGAWRRLVAASPVPVPAAPERPPELVYRLVGGVPILAWEIQLPLVIRPEPTRRTVWVSAESGELVDEIENVFTSRARVFADNPSKTPTPIDVALHEIDAVGPGVPLVGTKLSSVNCAAIAPVAVAPWHDDGDCYAVPRTYSDVAGDFYVALPDILDPDQSIDPDDLYAELSMYAHGERFLELMAERGLTSYRCEQSLMLANFRGLAPSGDSPYDPLDNAFFSDQCDPEKGATMVFGQGSAVDFAYDGDVIYHELGHGIVAMLAPEGLNLAARRSDGLLVDASAINEAIADYVSAMVTGDPELAEYVGRFWPGQGAPYIRTAENRYVCPDDLAGESHNDGEPLMGALWAARVGIGPALDDVVLQALTRLAPDATLEDMAATLMDVATEMQAGDELDERDLELLARELDARSLFDCPRVVTDPAQVAAGRTLFLRKVNASVTPFWPGPMQLRHQVPEGFTDAIVEADLSPRGDAEASATVLVKRADAPIAFTYDVVRRDDAGDPSGAATKAREVTLVAGDWDLAIDAVRVGGTTHRVRIAGLRAGEVIHVALAGTSTVDVIASSLRILGPLEPGEDGSGGGGDDGGASVREEVHGGDAEASCACTTGTGAHANVVPLLIVALTRRRRR